MIPEQIAKITTVVILTLSQVASPQLQGLPLSSHEISLDHRYQVKAVSDVFKDNILLNLAYLRGIISTSQTVNWEEVEKPFHFEFRLDPDKTFAFHDDVLEKYKNQVVKTTGAHFNSQEGFKTDGYLFGDGVCHLASLIYWVAKDAGLDSYAPTNHDFMAIPEIERTYGVSIYSNPYSKGSNAQQNLYVTNNTGKVVAFDFDFNGEKLRASVVEEN